MSDGLDAQRTALDLIDAALYEQLDGGRSLQTKVDTIRPADAALAAVAAAGFAASTIRALAEITGIPPAELVAKLRVPLGDDRPRIPCLILPGVASN